jgi:hypothetical protein
MSNKVFKAVICSLVPLLLFFGLVIPAFVQAQIGTTGGTTQLKSDMEMMSGIPVHGGGHFNWKVTGPAANELRTAVILNYDVPRGTEPPDGQLQVDEVERFAMEMERYLEGRYSEDELEYQGAKLRSFALLNRDIRDDSKGLIHTSNASTEDIEIRFYFDAWLPSGEEDFVLSDTLIADAIYFPVNETYEGAYKLEHTDYMVNIGNYAPVKLDKGDFFLIRTPFGEIYHYSVSFNAGENPEDKLKYEPFSWIECPLVLFIVVVVFGYFVVTMPGRYRRYDVMKNVKAHTFAKVLLIVLLLLYFFAGIGGVFISGIVLWILSVVFLFVSMVVSKTVYEHAERITTMPKKPDVTKAKEEPTKTSGLETEDMRKNVQCATCGEIFLMDEKFSISKAPCPACGSIGAVELGVGEEEILPPPPDLEPPPSSEPITKVFEGDEEL